MKTPPDHESTNSDWIIHLLDKSCSLLVAFGLGHWVLGQLEASTMIVWILIGIAAVTKVFLRAL